MKVILNSVLIFFFKLCNCYVISWCVKLYSSLNQYFVYSFFRYVIIHSFIYLLAHFTTATLPERTYFVGLRACSQQNVSVCSDTILTVRVESNSPLTFCPPFYIVSVNESARVNQMVIDLNSSQGDNVLYSFVQPVDPATAAAFYLNDSTVRNSLKTFYFIAWCSVLINRDTYFKK